MRAVCRLGDGECDAAFGVGGHAGRVPDVPDCAAGHDHERADEQGPVPPLPASGREESVHEGGGEELCGLPRV